MISFSEKSHKYVHEETGNVLYGWTSLIKNYTDAFDSDLQKITSAYSMYIGSKEYASLKYGRLKNEPIDEFIKYLQKNYGPVPENFIDEIDFEWSYAGILGSEFHSKLEKESYDRGFETNPFTSEEYKTISIEKKFDNQSLLDDLYELEDGYYPELLVWDNTMGQERTPVTMIDKCFIKTENGVRYVDVDDYKGLYINTPIFTTSGWKTMGTIEVGDEVYDGNGLPTKVKNLSSIHYKKCYKILFDTNDEIIADYDHKWIISEIKSTGKYRDLVFTTEELFDNINSGKLRLKKLPRILCQSIKNEDMHLPIDPYVLGLWLADGNRTCGTITCTNNNIWGEIEKRGYNTSKNHNFKNKKSAESRTVFGIRKHLLKLGLISNKHIPDIYMKSSFNQRLDLLRGFMDGDGYYNKTRKRFVTNTTSINQATYISALISSLGLKPTIIKSIGSGFKNNFEKYDVCFTSTFNPFLCRNTDIKLSNSTKYSKFRYIKSILQVDTVPTKCIEVESETHAYLAGINFIKTHNTNKSIYNGKDKTMKGVLSSLYDNTEEKYKLQACFGAKLMSTFGFKPRYCGFTHYKNYDKAKSKLYLAKYDENLMQNFQDDWKNIIYNSTNTI